MFLCFYGNVFVTSFTVILRPLDYGTATRGNPGFNGFLDFVHRPVFLKLENTTFRKVHLFPSWGEEGKKELTAITGLVQLLRLPLSKWPKWVGIFPPSPEDGKRSTFPKVVFSSFKNTGRWTKSNNPVILRKWACYSVSRTSSTVRHHQILTRIVTSSLESD
jgi:hypothetical protein